MLLSARCVCSLERKSPAWILTKHPMGKSSPSFARQVHAVFLTRGWLSWRPFPTQRSWNCCLVVLTITCRNGLRNPWKRGNELEFCTLCFKFPIPLEPPMAHWLAVCNSDPLRNITEPSRQLCFFSLQFLRNMQHVLFHSHSKSAVWNEHHNIPSGFLKQGDLLGSSPPQSGGYLSNLYFQTFQFRIMHAGCSPPHFIKYSD